MKSFEEAFSAEPEALASAPGRVNLLGEHTDYNDGFVLPTAIPMQTHVALRVNQRSETRLYAAQYERSVSFTLGQPPEEPFARYVYGCLRDLKDEGTPVPALDIHVSSQVPIGLGLSSSAALEVAVLRALRQLLDLPMDDVMIARRAQRAEIAHAGVRCGIMDQMASSLADESSMLFLDTRTLEHRLLPLPQGELLVLDSGIPRSLAGSAYNERRAECEQAASRLGLLSLRDARSANDVNGLPEPYRRRARHVVTENERVLSAVAGIDSPGFGALMNASHASLRDDFEVSVPALDLLVDALQRQDGVHGARLTGAGFGGACVALCARGRAAPVARAVLEAYSRAGHRGRQLVPAINLNETGAAS